MIRATPKQATHRQTKQTPNFCMTSLSSSPHPHLNPNNHHKTQHPPSPPSRTHPKMYFKDPTSSRSSLFMSLPTELHLLIINLLLFPELTHLKLTCTYFHTLIPRLKHTALIEAESTDFAAIRDIFACRYCLRLRPRAEFADRMLHRRRGRYGRDADKRFCVDCGLKPRAGRPRYGPGAQIVVKGVSYVICLTCRELRLGVRDAVGKGVKGECRDCLAKSERIEGRTEVKREKVQPFVAVARRKVWW